MNNFGEKVGFIFSVADLLRGPYRPNQYKDVVLPMTVLRRLDCALAPTKEKVLAEAKKLEGGPIKDLEPFLTRASGLPFYNTSLFTFEKLKGDPSNIAANLVAYIKGFSSRARDIIESFGFEEHIGKLDKADRLFLLVQKFSEIDIHPDKVSNLEMGYIFEELIRRFNEASNEEAGDHFTPREVIRLMVDLLFLPDDEVLSRPGVIRTLYDPACGTGGMLSVSQEYIRDLNRDASLEIFGQDYNPQSYAICGSDMMIKGQDISHIGFGDTFTDDHFPTHRFDYMLANPPFGVEWKPQEAFIKNEYETKGFDGRFGAGLPRINDGSLLFLQHMISKMKPSHEGGTRLAIVFNGSPLFTGAAGSGESEIRRWIIEKDWLEAIVALPDQLFYNTGISTYLWIITNRKAPERVGKVQVVDGRPFFKKMRKSLGNKRHEICEDQRAEIVRLYGDFREGEHVRIFDNEDFGYRRITVERPMKRKMSPIEKIVENLRLLPEESSPLLFLLSSILRGFLAEKPNEAPDLLRVAQDCPLTEVVAKQLEGLRLKGRQISYVDFLHALNKCRKDLGIKLTKRDEGELLSLVFEYADDGEGVLDTKGNPLPDPDLRDTEDVPLKEDVREYFEREVLPWVPDTWIDASKEKTGYEINFNRYFYKYQPPRPLEEIEADLEKVENEIAKMLSALKASNRGSGQ